MTTFPKNLFATLGVEQNETPDDFMPTFHYVMRCIGTERDTELILLRYRDGKTLEEIGDMLGVTRQRVQMLESSLIDKLKGYYTDMLRKGIVRYNDDLMIERMKTIQPVIDNEERTQIQKDSFREGYDTGFADAQEGKQKCLRTLDDIHMDSLDISVRSHNSFVREGIRTLGDFVKAKDNVMNFQNFGKTCFHEMADLLCSYGVNIKEVFPRCVKKFDWRETDE